MKGAAPARARILAVFFRSGFDTQHVGCVWVVVVGGWVGGVLCEEFVL